MNFRPSQKAKVRAVRPVVDGLESRELLSTGKHLSAEITGLRATPKRAASTIAQIAKASSSTVSTVPGNGDVNPYGVAFVPAGFPTGGMPSLNPGDVLVSNFNNIKNLQGTGTTIVRVTPDNKTSVFYQAPQGVGLTTALGILKSGFVLVGNVPSTDGTSATVGMGSLLVLDKNGRPVTNLTDPNMLNGPWDLTVNDNGNQAQVFVANVLSGTVNRLDVSTPANGPFMVTGTTQVASGYTHRGDPAAFELGPTGLALNPSTHTLYVASTADNAIYAVRNADTTGTLSGKGKVVYKDRAHLHGPLGLTFAPDGNLIAAQGDAINPSKKQPSELVEFTPKGKFVGQFSISNKPDGAFGVAASQDGQHFAAVNDNDNTVMIWPITRR
jgi:WD40 repeat protein